MTRPLITIDLATDMNDSIPVAGCAFAPCKMKITSVKIAKLVEEYLQWFGNLYMTPRGV